jgi:hypothetical protein
LVTDEKVKIPTLSQRARQGVGHPVVVGTTFVVPFLFRVLFGFLGFWRKLPAAFFDGAGVKGILRLRSCFIS